MPKLALLLLAAATAYAGTAQDALKRMEGLEASKAGLHPVEAQKIDRRLEEESRLLAKQGEKSRLALAWYAGQKDRPLRIRLLAAATLGLIGDPRALKPLQAVVRDGKEDPGMRAAALQALGGLGLDARHRRRILEEAAASGSEPVVVEALRQLAEIGCEDPLLIETLARRFGPEPSGVPQAGANDAVRALGLSTRAEADASLLRLLAYFKIGSPLRAAALSGLARQRLVGIKAKEGRTLTLEELETLVAVVFHEKGDPPIQAARLLGALQDRRAAEPLIRAMKRIDDPAVVTEAALASASVGDPKGNAAVLALRDGLIRDKRFRPREDQADPRTFALRIQEAAARIEAVARAAAEQSAPEEIAPGREFSYDGWPGAGRPRLRWGQAGGDLIFYDRPDKKSPSRSVSVPAGTALPLTESRVFLAQPGRVRSSKNQTWEVKGFGPILRVGLRAHQTAGVAETLKLEEAQTLEVLAYREDGQCFLRREAEIYLGACPQDYRDRFTVLEEPVAEWWVYTDIPPGKGWFLPDQDGVEFLPREF